jgi:hypothetical protein
LQVVDLKGQVLWGRAGSSDSGLSGAFYLSPDGTKVAMTGGILAPDGSIRKFSASFRPQGWIDDRTIIGWIPSGQSAGFPLQTVAIFHVDTSQLENWGFAGTFAGIVR